jgi:predicted TIM-barrel fold metal-dependent hydrolase
MAFRITPKAHSAHRLGRWLRRLALAGAGALLALGLARLAFFTGPYLPPQPLPTTPLVDLHCHVAGLGAGGSGCFVSPALRDNWRFGFYLRAFGVTRAEVEREGDIVMADRLAATLAQSRHVRQAVILALDGVADARGELDTNQTEFFVPNEFVAAACRRHTNLLFGASVNPYRHDALARLDWAATNGAVLVKWLPSIQRIDPADPRLEPFYRRLAALGLPLLTHTGAEKSFTRSADEFADPERLALPLRLGVTVVAAHVATTGAHAGERDIDRLARMMATHTNLFADISSLTQLNKLGYLGEALRRPEFRSRLAYGSDFPLINMPLVSPWYFPLNLKFAELRRLSSPANAWDRDVELKQALGVPADVFARGADLLRRPRESAPPASVSPAAPAR